MSAPTQIPPPSASSPPAPAGAEDELGQTILVAAIAGAFGAKGELRIKSFTQVPAAALSYAPFVDEKGREILSISQFRAIKGGFAVRASGIRYRDQAESLRGTKLYCLRKNLPVASEDEFYHTDIVGLAVVSSDGEAMGKVTAVHNFGASDMLEIEGTKGAHAKWNLPFTTALVPTVNIKSGFVSICDWEQYLPETKEQVKQGRKDA